MGEGFAGRQVGLPREVSKRFVGFGHFVRRFLLCDGTALPFLRSFYFTQERARHRLTFGPLGGLHYPAESEREPAVWIDFAGYLIVGATDAT